MVIKLEVNSVEFHDILQALRYHAGHEELIEKLNKQRFGEEER